ncbi:MAG: TRAP dicarboxylate transporter- DctP subunit [Candidatus Magnetoglobus multicellularis str. Araruama]|uniref:TRAP dicarboxylate transporter-DctP subunit n=1 Tax=Candidatus Magnetoglobus multicellularis str. Araruama TaxID=890399 RepID=A0A1V1PDX0_9BACT|nr:MAG: TRAP dicarboxylate transporter- DctP subunit [Candidatus Magnetoglobus multicellularis str. Araruama]
MKLFSKKYCVLIIIFLVVLTIISTPAFGERDKYIIKLATLAPKTVGWAKHIRELIIPVIRKETNHEVRLKYYWNGQLGEEEDYLRMIKSGELDGAAFSAHGTVLACPEMTVLELPFLFQNYDEVDYIRSKMIDKFDRIAEKNGFKLVLWTDQDFDQIYSTKYPLTRLEDFQKATFVSCFGSLEKSVLESFGVQPIVRTIKQGATDIRKDKANAFIGPALWVVGSQVYNKVKYINPMKIRYSPSTALVSLTAWNRIPKKYQQKIQTLRDRDLKQFCKKNRHDSLRAYEAMINYGAKVSTMEPDDFKMVQDRCRSLWYRLAGKLYAEETLEQILSHLQEYRERVKRIKSWKLSN